VTIGRDAIARLVPHHGAMCLLEEVLEWDGSAIACRAVSHRDPANPLRAAGALPAVAGIEYAGQAVAVHGALITKGQKPRVGYLAALRDVACRVERLDTQPGDLVVRATQVAAESGRLLYDFRVESGGTELLKGRLSVVLVSDPRAGHRR
jgi:predicted hotdog family 3-hydroxylacyl-ACP dehydratase